MLLHLSHICVNTLQVDAIVFLVDALDRERFTESKRELDGLLADEALGKASHTSITFLNALKPRTMHCYITV